MYLFMQPAIITSCNGDCVILLKYDVIDSFSVVNNNFNEVRLYIHSFLLFFRVFIGQNPDCGDCLKTLERKPVTVRVIQ